MDQFVTAHREPMSKVFIGNGVWIFFKDWLLKVQAELASGEWIRPWDKVRIPKPVKMTHISGPDEKGRIALAHGEQP
jgi:hypothetical protein